MIFPLREAVTREGTRWALMSVFDLASGNMDIFTWWKLVKHLQFVCSSVCVLYFDKFYLKKKHTQEPKWYNANPSSQ